MEEDNALSLTDDMYVNIIILLLWLRYIINLYRLQEEYHPTDDTAQTKEEEKQPEGVLWTEKNFILESCLLKLLKQCHSCDQKVEWNTFVTRDTLLVVNDTCQDGHVLNR